MLRDSQIPLFLWLCTALLAHLVWGGGLDRTAKEIEETREVKRFALSVLRDVAARYEPQELALLETDPAAPSVPVEPDLPNEDPLLIPEDRPKRPDSERTPEPERPEEQPKVVEVVPEAAREAQKELLVPDSKRRIAVRQHVKDKNQEDNPDAEFIGDEANKVAEQTRARITSTDQDDPSPSPGGPFAGPTEEPGNAESSRPGQSEESEGDPHRAPGPDAPPKVAHRHEPAPSPAWERAPSAPAPSASGPVPNDRFAGNEQQPHDENGYLPSEPLIEHPTHRRRLPPDPSRSKLKDRMGLGAQALKDGDLNLNLSPETAQAAIGRDEIERMRSQDGQRRRAQHRGSSHARGIDRWRSAIENYVPSVKDGNQTALNTARVPFASYLNAVHNRIHPVFADSFLSSLDRLPGNHPMNQPNISTNLEIVLDRVEGRLVRMGVTKTSGVTAFDIGALESIYRAQPFGAPPREIVSPDGNVYLHWEFHRLPYYACSTYFARPFILKANPKPEPPAGDPPAPSPFDPFEPPTRDRHGTLPPVNRSDAWREARPSI
jgi:hypothetical protein